MTEGSIVSVTSLSVLRLLLTQEMSMWQVTNALKMKLLLSITLMVPRRTDKRLGAYHLKFYCFKWVGTVTDNVNDSLQLINEKTFSLCVILISIINWCSQYLENWEVIVRILFKKIKNKTPTTPHPHTKVQLHGSMWWAGVYT